MMRVHGCVLTAMMLGGVFVIPIHSMAAVPVITESDRQKDGAQAWLELMDQGKFQQSFDGASATFRGKTTAATWRSGAPSIRGKWGARLTRGLDKVETATSVAGGPKGEYVIMTFASSFANKPKAVEKLTLMRESDGKWRTVSYTIN